MKKITCIVFMSLSFVGWTQVPTDLNSLRLGVKEITDPEQLTLYYSQLAWEYRDTRADSSLYFANQALRVAQANGLEHLTIQATNYMGVAYRNLSVYSKAFEKYLEALRLSEQFGNDEQRGYSLINLGNLYLYQTNYEGAIRYFIQALDQAQQLGDRRMQAYCYINLGRSYRGTNEFGQAELYYKQAIEIRKEQNDEFGIIAVEIDLADTYRRKGALNQSLNYFLEIIKKTDESKNPRALTLIYNNIARVYLAMGRLEEAQKSALKAQQIATSVESRFDEKEILKNLSDISAEIGDFEDAFKYHIEYAELNQQLFSEENIRKIEQLKNQYEIERQEAENEFLKRQAEFNAQIIDRQRIVISLSVLGIILLITVVLLIFRAYLIRKRYSSKIQLQKDQIEQDRNTIQLQADKLKELDKAKSRFFANVSHDLRSPLSLIIGNLEMITEDEESYLTPSSRKHLDVGFKNSKRLLYLTDEINDITRLEEGKINLRFEQVRVTSYLKMLAELFVSTAEYKGINLKFTSLVSLDALISIDPRQFEKIFYNIVSNAIRHTMKGDKIEIIVRQEADRIVIEFEDTGEGISQESLPHIFDRFYQSTENEYQSREGLGIGLALVKELVELHHGKISVSSELKKGTTFVVSLPTVVSAGSNATKTIEKSEFIYEQQRIFRDLEVESKVNLNVDMAISDSSKPNVLLVDDHPEIRYYIRQILEENYRILEAAHGLEAMDLLKEVSIDLIITDLMMPWMDGFELIEAINSNPDFKKIPLLVVSARISGYDKEKVLFQGVNDYLQKPFSKKELVLRIENLLKQKDKYASENQSVFSTLVNDNYLEVEKGILIKLENVVKSKISDPNLSVYTLTDELAASERQVYRLVKKLTGLTPYEYISEIRMQAADYLIRKNKVKNASEAAKQVGIKNVTTFSKQYEKKFGVKPIDILKN